MSSVLHLRKELTDPLVARVIAGVSVRPMIVLNDVEAWLALRNRATSELTPKVRQWTHDDFATQMLSKSWWRHGCTWLAVDEKIPAAAIVGAVTLAIREGTTRSVPIVHWLLVDPAWRRRGIGRLLMLHLERAAWDAGWREVELETHAGWKEAVAFYQSIGYAPAREPSPR